MLSNQAGDARAKSDMTLLREVTNMYRRDQKENLPPNRTSKAAQPRACRPAELANVSSASQNSSIFSLTPGPKCAPRTGSSGKTSVFRAAALNIAELSSDRPVNTMTEESAPSTHVTRGAGDVSADLWPSQPLMQASSTPLPGRRSSHPTPNKSPAGVAVGGGPSPPPRHDDSMQLYFNALHEHSLQTNSSVDETTLMGGGGALDLALDDLLHGLEWSETPAAVPMADEDANGANVSTCEASTKSATLPLTRAVAHGGGGGAPNTSTQSGLSSDVSPQRCIAATLRALSTPNKASSVTSRTSLTTSPGALLLPADITRAANLSPAKDGADGVKKGGSYAHHRALLENDDDDENDDHRGTDAERDVVKHTTVAITTAAKTLPVKASAYSTPAASMSAMAALPRRAQGTRFSLASHDNSLLSEASDHAAQLREEEVERMLNNDFFPPPPPGVFQVTAGSAADAHAALAAVSAYENGEPPTAPPSTVRRAFTVSGLSTLEGTHDEDGDRPSSATRVGSPPPAAAFTAHNRPARAEGHDVPNPSARRLMGTARGGAHGNRADPHMKHQPGLLITVGGRRVPVDTLHLLHVPPEEADGAGPSTRRLPPTTTAATGATQSTAHSACGGVHQTSLATVPLPRTRTATTALASVPSSRPRAPATMPTAAPAVARLMDPPPYSAVVAGTSLPTTHTRVASADRVSASSGSGGVHLLVTLQFFAVDAAGARVLAHPAFRTFHCNHDAAADADLITDGVSLSTLSPTPIRATLGSTYLAHIYGSESGYGHDAYRDIGVCTAICEAPSGRHQEQPQPLEPISGVLLREMDFYQNPLDAALRSDLNEQVQCALKEAHRQCAFLNLPLVLDKVHMTFDQRICVVYFKPSLDDASGSPSTGRLLRGLQFHLKCKVFFRWSGI